MTDVREIVRRLQLGEPDRRIAGYIRHRLEVGTMTGRLRRAGLLVDDGEDGE